MVFVLFCDYFSVWRFSPRDLRCLKSCVVDAILAILCYSTRGVHDESVLHTNILYTPYKSFRNRPMSFVLRVLHSPFSSDITHNCSKIRLWNMMRNYQKKHTKCYTANLIEKKQWKEAMNIRTNTYKQKKSRNLTCAMFFFQFYLAPSPSDMRSMRQ